MTKSPLTRQRNRSTEKSPSGECGLILKTMFASSIYGILQERSTFPSSASLALGRDGANVSILVIARKH